MLKVIENDEVDGMVQRWTTERPDLDVSSMAVLGRISLAAGLFRRAVAREYARIGLTSASFDVLAALRQTGMPYRLTPTQLYSSSRVSSGTMTNRLDHLEGAGLVVRMPDPNDRRGLLIELTQQGLQVVDSLVSAHAALGQQLVSSLASDEQACLIGGLRKLILSMEHAGDRDTDAADTSPTAGRG